MRTVLRRAGVAAILLALSLSVAAGALAADATVTSDGEFQAALSDSSCAHIYLNYNSSMSGFTVPGGMTVHVVGGHVWNLGAGSVGGSVVVESGAILCSAAGAVGTTNGVYVALTLSLPQAANGEAIVSVTADNGPLALYGSGGSVSGGSVTVYASKASMDGMSAVTGVTTSGGRYVLSGGSLLKQYAVSYSDVLDATGAAPQQASNAAAVNPTEFTTNDTLTLTEPTLRGCRFLGWTWPGQSTPQTGAVSVPCAGMTADLTLTAHWAMAQQGGGGRGAGTFSTAEEAGAEPAAAAESAEATTASSKRIPRGSSATKVSFTDGGGADIAIPTAESVQKTRFPWAFVIAAGAIAVGVVLVCVLRRRRYKS